MSVNYKVAIKEKGKLVVKVLALILLLSLFSCNEKFVAVSDSNLLHLKSGIVYYAPADSSHKYYKKIQLNNKEYQQLVKRRNQGQEKETESLEFIRLASDTL